MPEIIWVLFVSLAGLKGELVSIQLEECNFGQIHDLWIFTQGSQWFVFNVCWGYKEPAKIWNAQRLILLANMDVGFYVVAWLLLQFDAVSRFGEVVALCSGQGTVLEQALYEGWVGKMVKGLCFMQRCSSNTWSPAVEQATDLLRACGSRSEGRPTRGDTLRASFTGRWVKKGSASWRRFGKCLFHCATPVHEQSHGVKNTWGLNPGPRTCLHTSIKLCPLARLLWRCHALLAKFRM